MSHFSHALLRLQSEVTLIDSWFSGFMFLDQGFQKPSRYPLDKKSPDSKGVPRMIPRSVVCGYNGVPVSKVAQSL